MLNPFEHLVPQEEIVPVVEEVSGQFSCQEDFCDYVVRTAKYIEEVNVLTWKCEDGHVSSIKDFE